MKKAFLDIRQLQEEIEDTEHTITLVYHAIAENIAKNEENEEEIKAIYEPRLVYLAKKIETKVFIFITRSIYICLIMTNTSSC